MHNTPRVHCPRCGAPVGLPQRLPPSRSINGRPSAVLARRRTFVFSQASPLPPGTYDRPRERTRDKDGEGGASARTSSCLHLAVRFKGYSSLIGAKKVSWARVGKTFGHKADVTVPFLGAQSQVALLIVGFVARTNCHDVRSQSMTRTHE